MTLFNQSLRTLDPDIAAAVDAESHRQQSTLGMIVSENFAEVADAIAAALKPSYDVEALKALADKHPLYAGL